MTNDLMKDLIETTQKNIAKSLAETLYGDNALLDSLPKPPPPTLWQRIVTFKERAHDAWLVLTGRLDPYDS
jgi:hypothetical protein